MASFCIKDKEVLYDDIDEPIVKVHHWHLNNGYAATSNKSIYLHRLILDRGDAIDHINGNRLDNRRINLRYADKSVNGHNTDKVKQGYSYVKGRNCFRAQIKLQGRFFYLGQHKTAEEARAAYLYAKNRVKAVYNGQLSAAFIRSLRP